MSNIHSNESLVLGSKFTRFSGLTECTKAATVDVKFRCKVIRHLMSKSVSKLPIFGVFGDFSLGVEIYKRLGCIIKLHPDWILCESMNGIRSVTSEISV